MARIKSLPSIEIIRGFRGVLDFYVHRGTPCVRRWPNKKHAKRTQAEIAVAATFAIILRSFSLVGGEVKALYDLDAKGQPRTGRDLYVSGALGHLHEADMTDFLDLLTECRDLLQTLTAINNALGSVDTDDLQVDVKTLPTPLEVRGEDQLHSFAGVLARVQTGAISGPNGYIESPACSLGAIWHVTNVWAVDYTTATTRFTINLNHNAVEFPCHGRDLAAAAAFPWSWGGHVWLDPSDTIRAYFAGGLAGDNCSIRMTGEYMTLEA